MLGIAVDRLAHQLAIDRVFERRADCFDLVGVPVILMNSLRKLGGIANLRWLLLSRRDRS